MPSPTQNLPSQLAPNEPFDDNSSLLALTQTLTEDEKQALYAKPLSTRIHSRLDSISAADWERLFPTLPDSHAMISLTQRCGLEGYRFYSLVVCAGDYPILFLPLFQTKYNLLQDYTGIGSQLLQSLAPRFPQLFRPDILGVGFVEGEWGEVGIDREAPEALLHQAWQIANQALNQLAHSLKIQLVSFVDFKQEDALAIPPLILKQYTVMTSYPYGVLSLQYNHMDDYLNSLSKATRKDLRRKLKKTEALQVSRTTSLTEEQLERVFELYKATVARSSTSFGVQEIHFFREVCHAVPGTTYTLYHHADELIGFNLLSSANGNMVDKYFGMEHEIGKSLNLYFLSWLENVRFCIENGLSNYLAGPAAEEVKCRLGTRMLPTSIYFRHQTPWLHKLLSLAAPRFAYQPPLLTGSGNDNASDSEPESA